jgi:hypothetical protein
MPDSITEHSLCYSNDADLLEASGAKRDVDIAAGHVVFDYDMGRELAGALAIGAKISPIAMI